MNITNMWGVAQILISYGYPTLTNPSLLLNSRDCQWGWTQLCTTTALVYINTTGTTMRHAAICYFSGFPWGLQVLDCLGMTLKYACRNHFGCATSSIQSGCITRSLHITGNEQTYPNRDFRS